MISAGLVLASALTGAAVSGTASGLRGVVMRGPTKPICREGEPCEAPARGLLLRFSRAGVVRAQVRTSDTGWYRVRLRPGRYVVTVPRLQRRQIFGPRNVVVPRGHVRRVDFLLYTPLQ
jgi:hypothetical protein